MNKPFRSVLPVSVATAVAALAFSTSAAAADAEAAKALARQNKCFECHSISEKKDGPAWKEVAAKMKAKPVEESEKRLITHLTTGEKAKFPDGHEEEHKIIKTTPPKDMAQVKNLVDWILSL